jgi:hypothetical protein
MYYKGKYITYYKQRSDLMNQLFTGLTSKDVTYISDIMKILVVYSKKLDTYEQSIIDEQVKRQLHDTRMLLNSQFEQLLGVLQNG